MHRFWIGAALMWVAVPLIYIGFPDTVSAGFAELSLVQSGPWANLETLVLGGVDWLALGAAGGLTCLVKVLSGRTSPDRDPS